MHLKFHLNMRASEPAISSSALLKNEQVKNRSVSECKPANSPHKIKKHNGSGQGFNGLLSFDKKFYKSLKLPAGFYYEVEDAPKISFTEKREQQKQKYNKHTVRDGVNKLCNKDKFSGNEGGDKLLRGLTLLLLKNNISLALAEIELRDKYHDGAYTKKEYRKIERKLAQRQESGAYYMEKGTKNQALKKLHEYFFPEEKVKVNAIKLKNIIPPRYKDYCLISSELNKYLSEREVYFKTDVPERINLDDLLRD